MNSLVCVCMGGGGGGGCLVHYTINRLMAGWTILNFNKTGTASVLMPQYDN